MSSTLVQAFLASRDAWLSPVGMSNGDPSALCTACIVRAHSLLRFKQGTEGPFLPFPLFC
jgi:hypothetical protein